MKAKRRPEPNETWHWCVNESDPCALFTIVAWDRARRYTLIWSDRGFRPYDGQAFKYEFWHAEDECKS